jgi:hypothetical protein
MDINGYLNEIRALAASGQATEHSYRPALTPCRADDEAAGRDQGAF